MARLKPCPDTKRQERDAGKVAVLATLRFVCPFHDANARLRGQAPGALKATARAGAFRLSGEVKLQERESRRS